jgi:hypothetical protein
VLHTRGDLGPLTQVLDTMRLWDLLTRVPRLQSGTMLHHRALRAMHDGDFDLAELLFERAAAHYREEIAVEPLARLRAHQLIGRVRSLRDPGRASEWCLEAERLLSRLERIESLEPPFDLVDARSLLATWMREGSSWPEAQAIVLHSPLAA